MTSGERRGAIHRARFDLTRAVAALWIFAVLFVGSAHADPVAITFDDLPLNGELAPDTTRAGLVGDLLAILHAQHLPPSFGFINASKLEGSDDGALALERWIAGGQRVGNHTYSHMDLHKATPEAWLADLRADEPALELLDRTHDWHWLRYPYLREGDTVEKRRAVRAALSERGYRIAQVTLDFEDYLWNTPYARCRAAHDEKAIAWLRQSYLETATAYLRADRAMAEQVFGHRIDHVLLLHLGAFSPTILPDLLDLLRREGFTVVTLDEAEKNPAYATDPDAGSKYGGTLLEQWMDVRQLKYPDVPKKPYKELEAICRAVKAP